MTPSPPELMRALEATWPPAEIAERDGWRLRRGAGGGKRVSAAAPISEGGDVAAAERAMRDWGQSPLFQLTPDDAALDAALAARGFARVDPTVILAAPAATLLDDRPETGRVYRAAGRIAAMEEIWAAGGIGLGRLAVMDRAPPPATHLMARLHDRPAAVAFVAVSGGIAMLHALETRADRRREGAARMLTAGAARFAHETGAHWLAVAVTEANAPARGLYRALGMEEAASYHYRIAPKE